MTRKRIRTALKAAMLTVLVGSFAGLASAEDVRGRFRLSHEVRWGKAVLPAGFYTIELEGPNQPSLIRSSTGKAVALVVPWYVDGAVEDVPTGLIVSKLENERIVSALNWPEQDRAFVYASVPNADLTQLASAANTETVAVLWTAP